MMALRAASGIKRGTIVAACALALACALAPAGAAAEIPPGGETPAGQLGPFRGDGMWIWYIDQSNRGDLDSIADRAQRRGLEVLYIKSADGADPWSQFSPKTIDYFQRRGLKVCGWQYVYGRNPKAEARAAASAARRGADCFVIDSETEYEGRYVAADRYMRSLRARTGAKFPIGFTSFPYVDYHPWMPYSVFLRAGASNVNLPQVYWRAIGSSVDTTMRHTHIHNRIYEVPVAPIGQTYQSPPDKEVVRFRRVARAYGNRGVSWWSWQHTLGRSWKALSKPITKLADPPPGRGAYPLLRTGMSGDQVIWAQEHLIGAGHRVKVTGTFATRTEAAVTAFQKEQSLKPTGVLNGATWKLLLAVDPKDVRWSQVGNPSGSHRLLAGRGILPGAGTIMELPATPGRP